MVEVAVLGVERSGRV